ncbi:MAG: hypothetical protein PUD80_05830 [Firmicutes bacterium]|nr:hypothetical protein [Bacillota bacterium]
MLKGIVCFADNFKWHPREIPPFRIQHPCSNHIGSARGSGRLFSALPAEKVEKLFLAVFDRLCYNELNYAKGQTFAPDLVRM